MVLRTLRGACNCPIEPQPKCGENVLTSISMFLSSFSQPLLTSYRRINHGGQYTSFRSSFMCLSHSPHVDCPSRTRRRSFGPPQADGVSDMSCPQSPLR